MKDVSKFRSFGCLAYVYPNDDRRGKGKHIALAVEAVNLGFTTDLNTSAYKVYVPSNGKLMTSTQV